MPSDALTLGALKDTEIGTGGKADRDEGRKARYRDRVVDLSTYKEVP